MIDGRCSTFSKVETFRRQLWVLVISISDSFRWRYGTFLRTAQDDIRGKKDQDCLFEPGRTRFHFFSFGPFLAFLGSCVWKWFFPDHCWRTDKCKYYWKQVLRVVKKLFFWILNFFENWNFWFQRTCMSHGPWITSFIESLIPEVLNLEILTFWMHHRWRRRADRMTHRKKSSMNKLQRRKKWSSDHGSRVKGAAIQRLLDEYWKIYSESYCIFKCYETTWTMWCL